MHLSELHSEWLFLMEACCNNQSTEANAILWTSMGAVGYFRNDNVKWMQYYGPLWWSQIHFFMNHTLNRCKYACINTTGFRQYGRHYKDDALTYMKITFLLLFLILFNLGPNSPGNNYSALIPEMACLCHYLKHFWLWICVFETLKR